MDNVKRFEQYAADFEVAFSDDDWSVVGRHFAEEAVTGIPGRPSKV